VPILPGTSDERLLELVRNGEERAFEIVVGRYRASLVGYCRRLGLSESRAEDAVQQCFLSALLALRRGDAVRDLRAWLGRIAHNVAVNMMRSGSANRETGLETDGGADERAIHIPDLDGGLAAREALAEVAALPPMQREALLQSALGGRSYGEVAASMGVSEGAVRGLLHRARLALRNAAAIFSPLPLLRRISGWLGGPSPSAGRIVELAAPAGGTGMSATAVRAIGAGITAIVVAAGVAAGPLHNSSHVRAAQAAKDGDPALRPRSAAARSASASASATRTLTAAGPASPGSTGSSTPGPATVGTGTRGARLVQGPARTPTPRRESSSQTNPESQVETLSATTGPAQAVALGSGGASQPSAPPLEAPAEVKKQPGAGEAPGSDEGAQREDPAEREPSEVEHAEELREREAEERAEREGPAKAEDG